MSTNPAADMQDAARRILESGRIFGRTATDAERAAAQRLIDSRPYWVRLATAQENA